MGFWKPTLDSLHHLLAAASPSPSPQAVDAFVADVQQAMLSALPPGAGEAGASVARRIAAADDPQTLWYLRPDLMAVLGSVQGEAGAVQALERISARFQGMLPGALAARPSRLAGGSD